MTEPFKKLIANEYEATLSMLAACIDRCPPEQWDAPVVKLAFCQAVFHALFHTDCFLSNDPAAVSDQPFHRDHPEFFRDYEELEDRPQQLRYDRPTVRHYLDFCREKGVRTIARETTESLSAPCGFERLGFTRAELYVYIIRHLQHHVAQLSMRLRLNDQTDIPWVKSGWREV